MSNLYIDHVLSDRCCPDCSGVYGEHPVNLYYKGGTYTCPKCGCSTTSPDDDLCYKDGTRYGLMVSYTGRVSAFTYSETPNVLDEEVFVPIDFETFARIQECGCRRNYGDLIELN